MVEQVEYEEFRDNLPQFMGEVRFGDGYQLIIAQHGVPFAKVTDYYDGPQEIKLGVADGKFIIPDNFDSMMSDEIAEMFGVK